MRASKQTGFQAIAPVILMMALTLPAVVPQDVQAQERPRILPVHEADISFMQDMIHHHAQALILAHLVPERTDREDLNLLALRIERSQEDEIRIMGRWLERHGAQVPEVDLYHPLEAGDPGHQGHGDHGAHGDHDEHMRHDHSDMAGMLSPEQLDELAAAQGQEFERLFLEGMIYHHEGALDMVQDLFATPGAGQESEIFKFASHVDSDQRMEIGRMLQLLRSID